MNATLAKFLALQIEFFATIKGKVIPNIPPNPRGQRYFLTIHTCIECYPEDGWDLKLNDLLVKHGIDPKKFVEATLKEQMGFYLNDDKVRCEHMSRCPKIHEVLAVIAELIPE